MEVEKLLESVQLTEYEKRVYLALLKLNESKASEISRKSGIPQSRIYDVLDSLESKGFVEIFLSEPKKYKVIDIRIAINNFINLKEEEFKKLKEMTNSIKLNIQNVPKEGVWLLKGKDAWDRKAYEMIKRTKKEELYFIGSYFTFSYGLAKLENELTKRGVKFRMLCCVNKENVEELNKFLKYQKTQIRHYPLNDIDFAVHDREEVRIGIYGKTTPLEEQICIWIKNKGIANTLADYFGTIWKKAKPVKEVMKKYL